MTWTQTQLDELEAAIATGALRVKHKDGREAEYRSLKEMLALRDKMAAALGQIDDAGALNPRYVIPDKGLCP